MRKRSWKKLIASVAAATMLLTGMALPAMATEITEEPAGETVMQQEEEAVPFETMEPNTRQTAYFITEDTYKYGFASDYQKIWIRFIPKTTGYYEISTYNVHGDLAIDLYAGGESKPSSHAEADFRIDELHLERYMKENVVYNFCIYSPSWYNVDFEVIITQKYFGLKNYGDDFTVYKGDPINLKVDPYKPANSSSASLSCKYQWYEYNIYAEDYVAIEGATGAACTIPTKNYTDDPNRIFKCVIKNGTKITDYYAFVYVSSIHCDCPLEYTIKPGETIEIGLKNAWSSEGEIKYIDWYRCTGDPEMNNFYLMEDEKDLTLKLQYFEVPEDVTYYLITAYDDFSGVHKTIKVSKSYTPVDKKFTDVSSNSWFKEAVQFVFDKGIMTGMTSTTFGPAKLVSRAQFVTMLQRMSGASGYEYDGRFSDVPYDTWYTDGVAYAIHSGISRNGYGNGKFGPSDSITREQMATMLQRFVYFMGYEWHAEDDVDLSSYPDYKSVSSFSQSAMEWAVSKGLITGKEDAATGKKYLAPQGKTSRAECAMIIMRLYKNIIYPEQESYNK